MAVQTTRWCAGHQRSHAQDGFTAPLPGCMPASSATAMPSD